MAQPLTLFVFDGLSGGSSDARLKQAASALAGEVRLPEELTVVRPAAGRPYFEQAPKVFFSVTHSGDDWICAFADFAIGIDLQQETQVQTEQVANRFFHPREAAYLEKYPADFFSVWTGKESYVKYTGVGIDDSFGSFSVVGTDGLLPVVQGAFLQWTPFRPGCRLCVCSAKPVTPQLRFMKPQ